MHKMYKNIEKNMRILAKNHAYFGFVLKNEANRPPAAGNSKT